MKKLIAIQTELKAPKTQFNKFGGYYYRSAEDILEALKPLLAKHECLLLLTDDVEQVGDRVYVVTTVHFTDGTDKVSVTAHAREEASKKGMDGSQITGTASSYARKYALNGLFLIDDQKDSDYTNDPKPDPKPEPKEKPVLMESTENFMKVVKYLEAGGNISVVKTKYILSDEIIESLTAAVEAVKNRKDANN